MARPVASIAAVKPALRRLRPSARRAEAVPVEPAGAPPPQAPRGTVECTYAGLHHGRTLWLAVAPTAGTLALRDGAGAVLPLESDLPDDPDHLAVRADLTALPGPVEASWDVVVVPSPGGAPLPVWAPPLPGTGPVRVPPASGGTAQLSLARTDEGLLRVRRTAADPGVPLVALRLDAGAVVLDLQAGPAFDDRTELLLVADEGEEVLHRTALTSAGPGLVRAHLRAADLPDARDLLTRVRVAAADGTTRPVTRRRNDLANAGFATLLPSLTDPEDASVVVRLRWAPPGVLVARLRPEEELG